MQSELGNYSELFRELHMIIQDSLQNATKYSDRTHEFLTRHNIAPSPVNYSVVYLYVSNRNAEINVEIDRRLSTDKAIDSVFIDNLFVKYVSHSRNIEKSVLTPFEQSLTATLEKINIQVLSDQKIASSLKKADKVLSSSEHHEPIKNIVSFLCDTIASSQAQHQSLSSELAKTYKEVNHLKSKLKDSRQEAILDALTGLLNRRGCEDKLKDLDIEDVHSSMAIDIDHFKDINDTFGHFIGDKVIQRIAKVIKENVTESDLAVRFGGEEFIVVLVNKTIDEARKAAENIRLAIAGLKLMQRQSNTFLPPISVSIGITQANKDQNWSTLFKRADKALYQAKNAGRNCCVSL